MSCLSPEATTTITSRPKLTLQTTALPRTFGTSTTGLSFSFAAAPASSPTVRNTFKNAYEVASPASSTSPTKSIRYNKSTSPFIHRSPYQLPIGVRSILRNSPLEPARRQSGSISAGGNGPNGAGTRRVFFPAKKQVCYRYPLEEEIRTERYTAQHLDLVMEEAVPAEADAKSQTPPETRPAPSQDPEGEKQNFDSSPSSSETSTSDDTSADEGVRGSSLSKTERKKRRTMRIERQVRAVALLDDFEAYGSSTPQTPRQGRAKRRREWKWTLGPVDLPDKALNIVCENVSLLHAAQVNSGSEFLRVSTDFSSTR
ncbi:NADH oxidoreductase (quinone), F subunit [Penicillium digitatum]|uniref:Uncharacterized protein n=3 Tax=Penicillium digitatum TaxID=36651 RepID=K9F5P3_PEND2|nr:hypothetical protein PDIP_33620 [Penicillium digitatum Pd1]EKV04675.1 hypothetical protein PDIG_87600 [Penicillium digitatum PHI26]EKV16843.1 hypothetical protein PDIP_33620 [Penicillium digitatum Pd1]KAG0160093.1 hypothetical protein PDIDSM_7620 [Penicillium digitatum]QQK45805.1 NADH oxidoreductase (quinone), F subunit [Penicillium digitatum]